jgi:hypothetical protein
MRGDEADLLQGLDPGEKWPERERRLGQLRQDYEQFLADNITPDNTNGKNKGETTILSPGTGRGSRHVCYRCRMKDTDPKEDAFEPPAAAAVAEILGALDEALPGVATEDALRLCEKVLEVCVARDLHPLALAGRCGFEAWSRETSRWDVENCRCRQKGCWGNRCRAVHGLPPLTAEEMEAWARERERRKLDELETWRQERLAARSCGQSKGAQ